MPTRSRTTIDELRRTIEILPRRTRIAMLEGIRTNEIIVGAYSDDHGICPMLAAHRSGGRTSCIAFARAWDRFAFRSARRRRARRATARELLVLKAHLEASLLEDPQSSSELAQAVADHRELVARREQVARRERAESLLRRTQAAGAGKPRPGDRDRSSELRRRPGWSWLRVMRRYDEYQRALELLDLQPQERGPRELEPVN